MRGLKTYSFIENFKIILKYHGTHMSGPQNICGDLRLVLPVLFWLGVTTLYQTISKIPPNLDVYNCLLFSLQNQISEIKQAQTQGTTQLRSTLLDPAINIVFQRMGKEMDDAQEKLKQTQNELSAWKFTPDRCISQTLVTFITWLVAAGGC